MIDVRDNWRILLLVVLCILSALALFGPLGAGEADLGGGALAPEPTATATSDDGGEYAIELPIGEYDVLVDEIGYERFQDAITVSESNTTTLDISLDNDETGTVFGEVATDDGSVPGAEVQFALNETGEVRQTVETDDSGAFETELPPGEYIASADDVSFEAESQEITVNADERTEVDFTGLEAIDTATITGTVTDDGDPVSDLELSFVESELGFTAGTAETDADGVYEAAVPAGTIEIQITDIRYEGVTQEETVTADETKTVDFELESVDTGMVSGTVTAAGDPVDDAAVQVRDPETRDVLATQTTGTDGEYAIELPDSDYNVTVDELLFAPFDEQVTVEVDETTTLDIGLERVATGVVEGVVTDDDGPVSDIDIDFIDAEAGLGEDITDDAFRDPTNLRYGLQLSGGSRIRGELVGLTAENVGLEGQDIGPIESTIAEELGIASIDVTSRQQLDTIEVFSADVTQQEFADALAAAGLSVETDDISRGVTEPTIQAAVTTLTTRVDATGLAGADVFTTSDIGGNEFIVAEVPGVTRAELRDIIADAGRIQVIAGFPEQTENGTEYTQTELLAGDDISNIGRAQPADAQNPSPHVPVTLESEAAQRFQDTLVEAGFTTPPGVQNCFFDADEHDQPAEEHTNQYCLFTVVDGEYVHGSSMGQDLAQTLNAGGFAQNPSFIMQTSSFQQAQQLEINLRSGELPTDIEIASESFISPSLAQLFKPLALLTALIAWLAVCLVVYYWYRDIRVAIPMLVTASSEVFLLLGFAAAIGMALDLSHIAGFIAVIGTGLDDLIIMADEILQRKKKVETGRVFQNRFRKAFWIIGMAAATTIIAMSPLAVLSLGDLQGFAIVTIVGVLIGVSITRPAYGDVLRKLMLDDVKRK